MKNEELVNLRGGYTYEYVGGGTCAFKHPDGDVFCGMPKAEAVNSYDAFGPGSGANWCCDSCETTTWASGC